MRRCMIVSLTFVLTIFSVPVLGSFKIPRGAWERAIGEIPPYTASNCPKRGIALGGFGAGSFMYNICGSFGPWADKVGRYSGTWLNGAAFHVYDKRGEAVIVKSLCTEGSLMPETWNMLPVGDGTYYALQPKGWCVYHGFRSNISSEFFSPIIPHNYRETSYPVAIWRFHLFNPWYDSTEVSVMLTWPHPPFSGGNIARTGFSNAVRDTAGMVGIVLKATGPFNPLETQGSEWCIATQGASNGIISYASWSISGDGSDIWIQFADDGILSDTVNPSDSAVAIAVKVKLAPGDDVIIPIVISWDFPVVEFKSSLGTPHITQWWKRYCEYFDTLSDNSFDVAVEALTNCQTWLDQIDAWMNPFIQDPRYPNWLICAAFNELYYNQFGGSFWESGLRFGHDEEFMGLHPEDHKNFIMESQIYTLSGNINVGHYSSVVYARFWPEMERDLLRCHADIVLHYDDCDPTVPHQTSPEIGAPSDVAKWNCAMGDPFFAMNPHGYLSRPAPCAEGRLHVLTDNSSKFIQRCWRFFYLYNDLEFLEYVWPAVESTYHFMQTYDCDPASKDSLPDARGYDNTYDSWGMWGTDMYSGGLWIGALEAMDAMAAILNKPIRSEVQTWLEAARRNLDTQLWDSTGFYYWLDSQSEYPMAVFSDALCGQRYCEEYDLPDILPRSRMTSHLQKAYEINVVPNPNFGAKLGRMPDGSRVPSGDGQTFEYWVGTTYFVAAMMHHAGLEDEALSTAYGAYYPVYEADSLAYWFNTPEAWRDGGICPRPTSTSTWTNEHPVRGSRLDSHGDWGIESAWNRPHQYQRARAVWELMFEIQDDSVTYQCGDANGDGCVNIGDVIYLVNYLYRQCLPPNPLESGDVNCDGVVDIGDIVYLVNYLFRGGPPPCC